MTASLLFCVGSLTVVGSIQDGLTGDYQTARHQGGARRLRRRSRSPRRSAGASGSPRSPCSSCRAGSRSAPGLFEDVLVGEALAVLTSAGGVTIIGIALKLLDIKDVKVGNFLPALVIAPALVALAPRSSDRVLTQPASWPLDGFASPRGRGVRISRIGAKRRRAVDVEAEAVALLDRGDRRVLAPPRERPDDREARRHGGDLREKKPSAAAASVETAAARAG